MALTKKQKSFVEIALGAAVVLLLAAAYLFGMTLAPSPTQLPTTTLSIGGTQIVAEIAATPAEQEQGLSGRDGLLPMHGMFFVFNHPDRWGIWMKDMKFPIDILWADENGRVITLEQNVSPETYPKSFYPQASALYVVELPAGFAAAHDIAIGSQIVVK